MIVVSIGRTDIVPYHLRSKINIGVLNHCENSEGNKCLYDARLSYDCTRTVLQFAKIVATPR